MRALSIGWVIVSTSAAGKEVDLIRIASPRSIPVISEEEFEKLILTVPGSPVTATVDAFIFFFRFISSRLGSRFACFPARPEIVWIQRMAGVY